MAAGEPTTAAAENDGRERGEGDEPVAAAAPGDFKAFVGGLSWETTDEGLELYFGQFGEIVAAEVMRDRFTGQSRCFGFVSFATEDGLDVACKQHMHQIDGKEVEVKVAFRKERPLGPSEGGTGTAAAAGGASASASGTGAAKDRPEDRAGAQFNDPEKKIFVGGLLPETKEEDLVNHFSQYGDVKEAVIKYDESRRSRGFAFVTFETLEGVEKASEQTMQNLLGKRVEIKRHKKSNAPAPNVNPSNTSGNKSPTNSDSRPQRKKYKDRTYGDIYAEYFEAVARGRAPAPPGRSPTAAPSRGPPPPRDRDASMSRSSVRNDERSRSPSGYSEMPSSRSEARSRSPRRSRSPGRGRRMPQGRPRSRGGRR